MMTILEYVAKVGPWAPIYTHVTRTGFNINIGVALLRKALLPNVDLAVEMKPLNEGFWRFTQTNTVSLERIWTLRSRPDALAEPIIMCQSKWGDFTIDGLDYILVDGHHRYCLATLLEADIKAWLVPQSLWKQYQITGLPDTTKEALQAEPVTARGY